ncbi:hypothetical protein [Streptomyces griseoruber]|uniref:Uncharacterized protein n=1 Tax=Streptomyces griseoruber TaxID=1943 RepID=A0A101SP14_9ACTN|nr:hypothetical protein [Streptomyces griseoruber]KUN77515.1 hypothetical protein AQJ64_33880 [Streptomyces griseoruber]
MSARESFEDRLLAELKREIELRGETSAGPVRQRPVTPRRLVVALAVCAVVALAPVLIPGAPGGSKAYAVERHGDGSVTLTLKKRLIDHTGRRELAEALGQDDIKVLEWGTKVAVELCAVNREKPVEARKEAVETALVAVDESGRRTTVSSWRVPVVLHPGDKVSLCPSP